MLRYKVKLNEPKGYNEIKCDELYLSPDMSYISGVTDYRYELIDGQKLKLEFNDDNRFHDVTVNVENVIRQGYVILNQIFDVEEYKDWKGFYYVDGKYYFCEKNENNIIVNGESCAIEEGNKIHVNVVYWVENNKLTIGKNTYDVDIQLDKDGNEVGNHSITIKGFKTLPIINCSKKYWKKVTKFFIRKNNDYNLKLNDVSCAKKYPYFFYNVDKIKESNDETKTYDYIYNKHYLKFGTNKEKQLTYNKYYTEIGDKIFIQDYSKVKCNDEEYDLEYEWRNTAASDTLHLFLYMPQYNFTSAQKIIVESTNNISKRCDIRFSGSVREKGKDYIYFCGKKYYESKDTIDFLEVEGVEYQLHYIENKTLFEKSAYVTINDSIFLIKINGEKGLKLSQTSIKNVPNEIEYDIKKYHYITIGNDKFLVKTYDKVNVENTQVTSIDYVDISIKENFTLSIIDVINNSLLRCKADVDEDGNADEVCTIISENYKSMIFKLLNPIFEEYNVLRDNFILASDRSEEEIFDKIRIFNPSLYVKIPLLVGNDMATNVRQEDILENIFFKREVEKSINPYVDMEREIYYPAYKVNDDFKLINELIFDLHFRSRNLEDWKINDDVFKNLSENAKKELKTKYTWNIFDNYDNYSDGNTAYTYTKDGETVSLKPTIKEDVIDDNFKYYQPADLLYFLNFTTDDVFYQKSKIAKSFLRLLFFDSNDIANQTLLYSCTVWMNENKLYKIYIDNVVKNDIMYASINEEINDVEVVTSSTISVDNDTCDDNNEVTFEEDKRLAATFSVKNRYEAEESAEGFYLHIFKDYCEKLHEKTIYMKVEFNHAGEGRTINFTMPFRYDDEGNPILLDLSPEGDGITGYTENGEYHYFKEGYPLKELYEHLFIPINVVYNEKEKKYVYYLPESLAQNSDKEKVMKFNLYELKIKDES